MSTQVQPTTGEAARAPGATKPPSERIVIQYPTPAVDDGRYRGQARRRRHGHRRGRHLPRRPRHPPRRRPLQATARAQLARSRDERIDAHLGGVRWAGSFEVDCHGPLGVHGRGLDRRVRHLARRASAQGGRPAARPRRRDLRGRPAPRASGRTRPRPSRDKALIDHAIATLSRRGRPRVGQARRRARPRAVRNHRADPAPSRRGQPSTRPLAIEVDRKLAKFGAWYELFPRSWGGLQGVKQQLPRLAELGFDIIYLPPIHPIGHTNRKGRNNSLTAGPDDPGLTLGDRRRDRRPRRRPPRPGHDRRPASTSPKRPSSTTSRSRSTSRSSARPTTRGCTSTPSGSTAAPTARSSTPRTRPSATRTSTTSTGSPRTGRACGMRS